MIIEDFFWRAVVAGLGVAAVAGPLSCFVVWRRMAYFGAAMAHSALLGVALGVLLHLDLVIGVVLVGAAVAVLMALVTDRSSIADDTLLGILAHASLALGMVVIGLMSWVRVDLMGYLFGDILAVSMEDIYWIYAGGGGALLILAAIWRPLLAATVDEDLARAEGVPAGRVRLVLMLLIALVIAIAMKIVGVLLIASLIVIPAAAARRLVRTPEQMAVAAAGVAGSAVILGLLGSLEFDTAAGPSIVVAATALFALGLLPWRRRRVDRS